MKYAFCVVFIVEPAVIPGDAFNFFYDSNSVFVYGGSKFFIMKTVDIINLKGETSDRDCRNDFRIIIININPLKLKTVFRFGCESVFY